MSDAWVWRAEYTDGTALDEFDEGGDHGFREIDQSRLRRFLLIPTQDHLATHALMPTGDARPIFFRRRSTEINHSGDVESSRTVHCIGMQQTVGGRNVKAGVFLFDDGSLILTNDLELVQP